MNPLIASALVAALSLTASPAFAEQAPPAAVADTPSFATMDRVDRRSHVDLSLATSFFEGDDPDFNARFDAHAQYVTPQGMGGYATLPLSHITGNDESETALGNLEVGGIYAIAQGPTDIVLRGGLVLPTADDEFGGIIANFATATGRFTDFVLLAPETTFLRLGGSGIHRAGNMFARADLGLDVPVDTPEGSNADPIVRANVGVGVLQGKVAVMAELVTVGTTGDVDEDDDRFLHTAAITVRLHGAQVSPFASLVVPLDANGGLFSVDAVLMAGLQLPLGN